MNVQMAKIEGTCYEVIFHILHSEIHTQIKRTNHTNNSIDTNLTSLCSNAQAV